MGRYFVLSPILVRQGFFANAGTIYECNEQNAARLMGCGALRELTEAEVTALDAPKPPQSEPEQKRVEIRRHEIRRTRGKEETKMSKSIGDSMKAVGGAVVTGAKQGAGYVAGREIVAIAKEAIPGLGLYLGRMPEPAQVLLAATLVRGLAPHLPQGEFIAAAAEGACAASAVMVVQTIRPDLVKRLGNVGRRFKGEPVEEDASDAISALKEQMTKQAEAAAEREERLLAALSSLAPRAPAAG